MVCVLTLCRIGKKYTEERGDGETEEGTIAEMVAMFDGVGCLYLRDRGESGR